MVRLQHVGAFFLKSQLPRTAPVTLGGLRPRLRRPPGRSDGLMRRVKGGTDDDTDQIAV